MSTKTAKKATKHTPETPTLAEEMAVLEERKRRKAEIRKFVQSLTREQQNELIREMVENIGRICGPWLKR